MAKVGWGTTIGSNMLGVLNVGFGGINGNYEAKANGLKFKSDTKMGTALHLGYDLASSGDTTQFFGGIGVTHLKFNFSEMNGEGAESSVDKTVDLNYGHIHGGVRFKF
jgi:hypothetical protein